MSTPPAQAVIIRTGTANLASVCAAFARCGVDSLISDDPDRVAGSPLAVLPGVGAFGAAMTSLRATGLDEAVRDRFRRGRPLLAICLGMQLLCDASDESPGVAGLGLARGRITRFNPRVRVPQMGWNTIEPDPDATLMSPGWMYFANSFHLEGPPPGWACARTDHGGLFVSAMQLGPVLACQFHPELSGAAGLTLIRRWVASAGEEGGGSC